MLACTDQSQKMIKIFLDKGLVAVKSNGYNTTVSQSAYSLAHVQYITMTSQWVGWRLKSPASRLFTQPFIRAQIKDNIKDRRHWPLCWEFTGDRWIPCTNGQ